MVSLITKMEYRMKKTDEFLLQTCTFIFNTNFIQRRRMHRKIFCKTFLIHAFESPGILRVHIKKRKEKKIGTEEERIVFIDIKYLFKQKNSFYIRIWNASFILFAYHSRDILTRYTRVSLRTSLLLYPFIPSRIKKMIIVLVLMELL